MSKPLLSVVIACHNDPQEIHATAQSIANTAPLASGELELVVVDDCSSRPVALGQAVNLVRNSHRCGVGPSRHIGVLAARGQMILIVDSHMRFTPGWFEALTSRLADRPTTLICGTCLGLDANNMDLAASKSVYQGATINVLGPDRNNARARGQVFEAVWNRGPATEDDAEICCVMGAQYAMHRDWFLKIAPLHNLRSWGEDEILLSVKTWLAGGSVRLHKGVRIGHRFRLEKERQPYSIPREDVLWNKLFAIHTLTPPALAEKLVAALRKSTGFGLTQRNAESNWSAIEVERAYNRTLFTRDFLWLAQKFSLSFPGS